MNKKSKFNTATQMIDAVTSQINDNMKNVLFDKSRQATVKSYDISTNIAVVNFPDDTSDIELPNFSSAYLKANDLVLVKQIRGSLKNAYIDKNITSPNRQQDWIAPTLLNGWVNFGTGFYNTGYYKNTDGNIYLRGTIKNGTTTSGTVIFTLPTGYRPLNRMAFPVASGSGTLGRIDVLPTGDVIIDFGSNSFLYLSPVIFRAEQ
jgi:hypothetical protein